MEIYFSNIDQGLMIFYTTVIIAASLAYLSAKLSESSHASRRHHSSK